MKPLSRTGYTLLALVLGLGLGVIGHKSGQPVFKHFGEWTKTAGTLWITALQLIVIPLVITTVIAAIANAGAKKAGKLGLHSFLLFWAMLLAAGLFTIALAPTLVKRLPIDPESITLFAQSAAETRNNVTANSTASGTGTTIASGLKDFLPNNLFEAGVKGNILVLLLFSVGFALAISRLPVERRDLLINVFRGLADAMLQLTNWILLITPVGVFALAYGLTLQIGLSGGEILAFYIAIVSGLMLCFTLLLYPLTAIFGGTTIGAFTRAVAPAQLVAVTTRSSIAALPALVEGAREKLNLPASGTSFVLPLAVTVFKINRPIANTVKLVLVAHLYGIALGPSQFIIFLAIVMILNATSVGIPQNGPGMRSIPAYLAVGVPLEGIFVLEAVEAIPDIFKTLINVTGDMSVAAILTKSRQPVEGQVEVPEGSVAESVL